MCDSYIAGDLISLGLTPIATDPLMEGASFKDQLGEVAILEEGFQLEAVMAQEPDLIIIKYETDYDKFSQIAPTIVLPWGDDVLSERLELIGKALGKEQEAQAALAQFETKVAEAKDKLAEAGIADKTITIFDCYYPGDLRIFGNNSGRGGELIYEYLGFKAPENVENEAFPVGALSISLEVIQDYVGDYAVILGTEEGVKELSESPIWETIPAVQAGNVIELDYDMFMYMDLYSLNVQLDNILTNLLATAN